MKNYLKYVAQDRRLAVLIVLSRLPSRSANHFVLRMAVRGESGHYELPETIVNDLSFLAGQGLVLTEELPGDVVVATLTDFGEMVAKGTARASGVAVPAVG